MRRPPISLQHQLYKIIAAARARLNSTSSTSAPRPHSYFPSQMDNPIDIIMEDPSWEFQRDEPSPIAITIDESIEIVGNSNKILLPREAGLPMVDNVLHQAAMSGDNLVPSTPSAASSRKSQQKKASQLAAAVIAILSYAGTMKDDLGRSRPINITVKDGVRVKGCNNTVSTQEPFVRPIFPHESTGAGSKRRATSEPPESPPPRKRREMKRAT